MDPKRDVDAPAFSFGGRPGERRGDYEHPKSLPVLSGLTSFSAELPVFLCQYSSITRAPAHRSVVVLQWLKVGCAFLSAKTILTGLNH
jgi:hypothetical protein